MRPLHSLLVLIVVAALVVGAWLTLGGVETAEPAVATAAAQPAGGESPDGAAALVAPEGGDEGRGQERVASEAPPIPEPAAVAQQRPKGPALRGIVLDPAGEPLAGAIILAGGDEGFGLGSAPLDLHRSERMPWVRRFETTTGDDGRFELRGPQPGAIRMAVRAVGFAPWDREDVVLPADEVYELDPITLAPSVVLTGRVVDPDGRAVAGADLLRVTPMEGGVVFGSGIGVAGVVVATTASDGSFQVDQLASGSYTLRIAHEDHPDQYETGKTHAAGERVDGLTIVMEHGLQIHGRVVGAPSGANATLLVRARPDLEGRIQTGAHGVMNARHGQFPPEVREADVADDGSWVVRGVRADERYGIAARRKPRSESGFAGLFSASLLPSVDAEGGDRGVELPYQPEGALVFQVVDAQTREPITDFKVAGGTGFLMPMLGEDGRMSREHEDGRARFGNLRPRAGDRVKLRIEATGYRDEVLDDIEVIEGVDKDLGIIALESVPVVRVAVVDNATGEPVRGARVILKRYEEPEEGFGGVRRQMEMEVDMDIDADDHGGGSIRFGDGEARTEITDDEGIALLTSFQGERSELEVRHANHAPYRSDPFVPAVGQREEVLVRMLEGGTVTVLLQTPDGAPVAGGRVEHEAPGETGGTWNFSDDHGGDPVADSEGLITFEHLAAGTHRFRPGGANKGMSFSGDDGSRVQMRSVMIGGPKRDDNWTSALVSEGSTEEVVVVAPVRVAIAGRVTEGGEPLEDAVVRLNEAGSNADPMMARLQGNAAPEARTDGRGEYRLENVKSGAYTVEVTHPTRRMPSELDLSVAEEDVNLDVDLTVAVLEGRVTDEFGKPLAGVRVWPEQVTSEPAPRRAMMISIMAVGEPGGGSEVVTVGDGGLGAIQATTDADGYYQLRGVQEDVDLVVKGEGESVKPGKSEVVRVVADQTRRGVDFVLGAAGKVEVQAFTDEGKPGMNLLVTAVYEGEEAEEVESKSEFMRRGTVTLVGLTPGPWRVSVRDVGSLTGGGSGAIPDQVVDVTVGETETATFTVP